MNRFSLPDFGRLGANAWHGALAIHPWQSVLAIQPWQGVLAVHILSIVLWVGGMFFAVAVLPKGLKALEPARRIAVHNAVFRRFFLWVWLAMPVAIITGYLLIWLQGRSFADLPWNIDTMQGLGWVMAILFLGVVFGPYRRFRAAASTSRAGRALDRIHRLNLFSLVFGLINVIIAAL